MPADDTSPSSLPPSGAPPQRTSGGGMKWTPPSPEHLQRMLPAYDVFSMLGHGGMGAVYKARQKSLDRMVAIKILPPEAADDEAQFIARFQNEARTMAKMNHPAIVGAYDFGETSEGQLYFVMEFVDGTDVAQMIKSQGRLPPDHALAITAHVCDALDYAHNHGVIHRDIKPANILINREGAVKVADFGLAKLDDPSITSGLTKSNMAMGTPDFVAPEVLALGVTVDHRADLYAIGVMLYQMLTGEIPRGMFRLPSQRVGSDPRFDAIISKAMESDRETRYQTAREIRHDLDRILTTPMVQAGDEQGSAAVPERSLPQKPVAHAPHRPGGGNAGTPHYQDAATPHSRGHNQKKSSTGLYLGLAATVAAIGAAVFLLSSGKKEAPKPVAHEKQAVANVTPVSQPPKTKTPKPAPVAPTSRVPLTAPVPALTAKAVEVLPVLVLEQDVVYGDWKMQSDGLVYRGRKGKVHSRVELPFVCSGSYVIEAEVSTVPTPGDLVFHLPYAKESAAGHDDISFMVDHGSVQRAGFAYFEGKSTGDIKNPAWVDMAAPLGHKSRLTVKVELKKPGRIAFSAWRDGKPLVGWEGDRSLTTGAANVWRPNNQPCFAIGTTLDGTVFHRIRVEALDGEIKWLRDPATVAKVQGAPMPAPGTTPPAAPAMTPDVPAAPASTDPISAKLANMEKTFLDAYEKQIGAGHKAAVADLNEKFTAALDRTIATVSQAGKLDEALALRNEKTLIGTSGTVPEEDAPDTPASLQALRKTYRATMATLLANRDKNAAPLHVAYDRALAAYQDELTKTQKLDDATRVKAVRDALAARLPQTAAPVAPVSTTAPSKPASATQKPTPTVANEGGSSWRRSAEWVLSRGGGVTILDDTKGKPRRSTVADVKDLPAGKFEVVEIRLDMERNPSDATATMDEEMRVLSGLKSVEKVVLSHVPINGSGLVNLKAMRSLGTLDLSGTNVTDEALASLSGLTGLTELNLDSTAITDAGVKHLAPLTNLKMLDLSSRGVTGTTLGALAGCTSLTELYFGGAKRGETAVTDEGLRALATANLKNLKTLGIHSMAMTDAGLAHLTGMKLKELILNGYRPGGAGLKSVAQISTLEGLTLGGTELTDADIAVLPQLTSLTRMLVYEWHITDAGLKVLESMPLLRTVGWSKAKVTAAGTDALQKVRPNLKVTRGK